uniref:Transposase, mutator type n=1 Tax=Tanacetum cinerariifolium TaxID=118510 RepID=A0A6L2NV33_TANCI|nr:hypothetical protein [Tanacetum cinerariifolium]
MAGGLRQHLVGLTLMDSLGLDYGMHSLNVDADVLEMTKYVKDYKIILVYIKHGSSNVDISIFVKPKKGVAIAVDNHLRKDPIEIDSSSDVNRNLTPIFVEAPIVVECAEDPFEELDDILGEYAHIRKQITGNEITRNEITRNESIGNEITGKQMVVRVGNSSTVDDMLELDMLFETEGVGLVGKFKEVEHDDVFDDDEHIVEEVHANINNFRFTADPKHDTSICGIDVQDDDLDVINYDSFGSDLDDRIDSERIMQLGKLRRIGKQKNKGPNKYYFYLEQQFASKEIMKGIVKKHSGVCVFGSAQTRFRACRREILGLNGCFTSGPWPGQILTTVEVDANNEIYPVAYAVVEAETKATSEGEFKKKIGELKSFNSYAYDWLMKIPLEQWSRDHFSGRAKYDLLINNIFEVFNRQLADGRDQSIITCLEYIREYLTKRIVVVQKVIAKTVGTLTPSVIKMFDAIKKATEKWELTGLLCKLVVAAIYNMFENSLGVVVESRTVIIPPLYTLLIGRPPKKRKKSNDEIASQSASLGKLSRKGKSVSCGKCGNVGHNRKGCRGQGGGSSQAGAMKVSSQAVGATNVSGQVASVRKVSGQAAGATNVSCQAAGARKVSGQAVGSRKVYGQATDARKASSQPSASQSIAKQ